MRVGLSTRWAAQSTLSIFPPPSIPSVTPACRRPFSYTPLNSGPNANLRNDLLQKLLTNRRLAAAAEEKGTSTLKPPTPDSATLERRTTIFNPDYEIPGFRDDLPASEKSYLRRAEETRRADMLRSKDAALAAPKLDPDPQGRRRWERKMVIKGVRRRGRLTKYLQIARSERQSLFRSQDLPTSVKKLTKIMNLVKGMTVEEALVQLRFNKKRVARDVAKGLSIARDEAVVGRGMGLGSKNGKTRDNMADGTRILAKSYTGVAIELRDGKTKEIHDPTEIYIEQAWVGKGEQWKSPEYRARGRVNLLTHRTTSFSVLLKEEKTRMRISEDIRQKRSNRKLWVALPDRPITSQRQYCLW